MHGVTPIYLYGCFFFFSAQKDDNLKESLDVRKAFSKFLCGYINRNSLQISLLSKMVLHLVSHAHVYEVQQYDLILLIMQQSISDQKDDFQSLVLDAIHHVIVPDITAITQCNENFKTLLIKSIKLLKTLKWLHSMSNKEKFCWGVLATYCSKIKVSIENTDWPNHFWSIFTNRDDLNLGTIFSGYCKAKSFPDGQRITTASITGDMKHHYVQK